MEPSSSTGRRESIMLVLAWVRSPPPEMATLAEDATLSLSSWPTASANDLWPLTITNGKPTRQKHTTHNPRSLLLPYHCILFIFRLQAPKLFPFKYYYSHICKFISEYSLQSKRIIQFTQKCSILFCF